MYWSVSQNQRKSYEKHGISKYSKIRTGDLDMVISTWFLLYLLLLKFFFCFLFLLYFTLQSCMVLPYIDMNPHGCTCIPKHEPPSHLLPHNISLGQALILNMGKGIPLVCHTEGILPMLTCVVSQPFPHFVANKSLKEEQGGVFLEDAHPVLGTHLDLPGIQRM